MRLDTENKLVPGLLLMCVSWLHWDNALLHSQLMTYDNSYR